jgi:hypothetical protein
MKKEIVFVDEETLTKEELDSMGNFEPTEARMKEYYEKWEEMNGETEE